ncbi:MAG: hypothetical protein K8Q91_02795 [Candidatus Vogelbacteria bacterium]|nr:hypothetical protein [Candidatus Vogelbacteria bacterium]
MNSKIKPAIISGDFNEIMYKIGVVDEFVEWVHLDVMDGKFATSESWHSPDDLDILEGNTKLEVHLMIENPEDTLVYWTRVADRVLVHYESTEHLENIFASLEPHSTKLGLAVLFDTPLEKIQPYLNRIDFIQLMGVEKIGYHGQLFNSQVLERIKTLREMSPNATIQIDGGVTMETGKQCLEAGADILVVGSGIWQAQDHTGALQEFLKL